MWRFLAGVTVGALAVAGAWWVAANAFVRPYTESSLHRRWQADGTLAAIESAVMSGLDVRSSPGEVWRLLDELQEQPVVHGIWPVEDSDGKVIAYALELGGADNHHGMVVGDVPPTFLESWPVTEHWNDRIWWYDDLPPQRRWTDPR